MDIFSLTVGRVMTSITSAVNRDSTRSNDRTMFIIRHIKMHAIIRLNMNKMVMQMFVPIVPYITTY